MGFGTHPVSDPDWVKRYVSVHPPLVRGTSPSNPSTSFDLPWTVDGRVVRDNPSMRPGGSRPYPVPVDTPL